MFDGDELVNYESTISTLSYLINLQETKLEHENEEETYINQETEQLIEERKEVYPYKVDSCGLNEFLGTTSTRKSWKTSSNNHANGASYPKNC